jgi:hypothetical protein
MFAKNNADPQEKRAMRRFPLQLPVTLTTTSGEPLEATAESRDVSSHGICFYCDAALAPDSVIEFTVTLPAEVTMTEPISVRCNGTVVRVENNDGGGKFAIAAAIDSYEFVASDDKQNLTPATVAPPIP